MDRKPNARPEAAGKAPREKAPRLRARVALVLLMCLALSVCAAPAEDGGGDYSLDEEIWTVEGVTVEEVSLDGDDAAPAEPTARDDFIGRIIDLGRSLYEKANGKAQRAHYKGDIYVCKNFTTYLFRENRADFRMAAFPDVTLVIPDNLPKNECRPYAYGLAWKDIPPEQGNPFYAAAAFRYDANLSKEENMALAMDFLRGTQRGDFLQMTGNYGSGNGAHSAIMLAYDPATDSLHWMDSNMRHKKINGINYGYVQFDEVRTVEWWAKNFCQRKCGATLYRLRDDIVYAGN